MGKTFQQSFINFFYKKEFEISDELITTLKYKIGDKVQFQCREPDSNFLWTYRIGIIVGYMYCTKDQKMKYCIESEGFYYLMIDLDLSE